jgi:2-polyprenyl-6-methoxyphenol hydroxylase-like FAD-dependent oxidoreductase
MTDTIVPVVIIGGGPVGLSAALELDHHGIPVTLVEPRRIVEHSRPRAKTTSARTMELFRRWGVSDRLRAAAPLPAGWSQRITFVRTVLGPEITHLDGALGLGVSPEISPETAQQVSQGIVEDVLRATVAERPGITTYFGHRATEVVSHADAVDVVIADDAGGERRLLAAWVIGADGPRSVVRHASRSHYEGSSGGRPNVNITFRSRELAALVPHPPSIHYWVLDDGFPGVVGPLDTDGTWWAISTGTERVDSVAEAVRIVRGLVGGEIDVEIVATDPWQARMLLADDYRDGRLFLVGDAAHQNPPWGGHGFNTGVGDAVNLGWKLAAVLNGWAPEALLDSYSAERRPVGAQTIDLARTNMAALSINLRMDDAIAADPRMLEEATRRVRTVKGPEFYADGLVFGYGYTSAAAEQAPRTDGYRPVVAAGNRLPHRLVRGRPIYDLLGREFTVIGPSRAVEGVRLAAAAFGIPLVHVEDSGDVVVVRPDQHIAWTGAFVEDPRVVLEDAVRGFPEPPRAVDLHEFQ